ncbi:MAG: ATP-binding protein [bacterium]|nr:ATP-binding protein [bacterium]
MPNTEAKGAFKELSLKQDSHDLLNSMSQIFNHMPAVKKRMFQKSLVRLLDEALSIQEKQKKRKTKPSQLQNNINEFTELFGLTENEAEVCLFLALMSSWSKVENYFDIHLDCDRYSGQKFLLAALDLNTTDYVNIVHGKLRRLGFINQDSSWLELNRECLPLINESAKTVFAREHYRELPAGTVDLNSHTVKREELEHIKNLLEKRQKSATHILLYGEAGTGKTSFTRALASSLSCPAYEVLHNTENKTHSRRLGLIACLNLTNHGEGSLVVVDEADNLLNTADGWSLRGESQDKGWLNDLLEEPGTRVVWITNRVDNIDPSVLRRFAFSHHFPAFSRRERQQVWDSILRKHKVKRMFRKIDIQQLAQKHEVSAGVIDLAVAKARETGFENRDDLLTKIGRSLAAHLKLTLGGKIRSKKNQREQKYIPEALNLDCQTNEFFAQVKRFDHWWRRPAEERPVSYFNLLFHGPSGTGKTELARHLAHLLDRPLIIKRMSDLLGAYVGQTEQALAAAFAKAEIEESILLIDEADSLLFPRSKAGKSWEVSFTNEFLTQMEQHVGMLICTTNRKEGMDEAAMRRFGRKVEFGYLKEEGILALYAKLLGPLVGGSLTVGEQRVLGQIQGLTPGAFGVVRDLVVMGDGEMGHGRVIGELEREALESEGKMDIRIGF